MATCIGEGSKDARERLLIFRRERRTRTPEGLAGVTSARSNRSGSARERQRPKTGRVALRDYYSMAALIAKHPALHLTINLTPVLLWRILDYVEQVATARHLELTRAPALLENDASASCREADAL